MVQEIHAAAKGDSDTSKGQATKVLEAFLNHAFVKGLLEDHVLKKDLSNLAGESQALAYRAQTMDMSGDFCVGCFRGEACLSRVGVEMAQINLIDRGTASTRSREATGHLRKRGVDIVEATGAEGHCMIKWGSKADDLHPIQLVDGAVRQGEVAVYCAYENTEDVYEIDEAALCSKKINLCGVKATPPCYKRHVQKVPVTSLRPPAAFQMLEIETATTDGRERHRFRLPPDVLPTARAAIAEDEARFPAAVLY